jgi:hypothetical protein
LDLIERYILIKSTNANLIRLYLIVWVKLTVGPLEVAIVVDSQYRNDTYTILANTNLGIGDPMQSVADGKVSIELLDIDWQKFPADAKNASR